MPLYGLGFGGLEFRIWGSSVLSFGFRVYVFEFRV